MNPDKTQAIIFGTVKYTNAIDKNKLPNIKIKNTRVELSSFVKYLGIYITDTLSWERQVTKVTSSIRSKLYQLKISKHLLPDKLKVKLIVALVFPHLDYCCAAMTDITGQHNLRLQRVLNACAKFVCGAKRDEHITPYLKELKWLKTEMRRNYFVGCQLFSILQSHKPEYLYEELEFRKHARATRPEENLLILPLCRTEAYRRSYKVSAIRL